MNKPRSQTNFLQMNLPISRSILRIKNSPSLPKVQDSKEIAVKLVDKDCLLLYRYVPSRSRKKFAQASKSKAPQLVKIRGTGHPCSNP
jgi:hypothetical protein